MQHQTFKLKFDWLKHKGTVRDLCVWGDDIVSAGQDKLLRVWSPAKGRMTKTLIGHSSAVSCCVAWGDTLFSASSDCTIRAWEKGQKESTKTFTGHDSAITALIVWPSENLLVSGDNFGTIIMWTKDGEQKLKSSSHSLGISTFGIWGNILCSGSEDRTVRLWKNGKALKALSGIGWVEQFCMWGENLAAGAGDGSLTILDTTYHDVKEKLSLHSTGLSAVAECPVGGTKEGYIATGCRDGHCRIWDHGGKQVANVTGGDAVADIVYIPDRHITAVGFDDGRVLLLDNEKSFKVLQTLPAHESADVRGMLCFKGDLVTAGGDGAVRLWTSREASVPPSSNIPPKDVEDSSNPEKKSKEPPKATPDELDRYAERRAARKKQREKQLAQVEETERKIAERRAAAVSPRSEDASASQLPKQKEKATKPTRVTKEPQTDIDAALRVVTSIENKISSLSSAQERLAENRAEYEAQIGQLSRKVERTKRIEQKMKEEITAVAGELAKLRASLSK